jgi:hypothetical protein
MPQLTFPISTGGLELPVLIGLNAAATSTHLLAGQMIPKPILAMGEIDTGANHCSVAPSILRRLGVKSHASGSSSTATGPATVSLYRISLSVVSRTGAANPMLTFPDLEVTNLLVPLSIEVFIGLDAILDCQLLVDDPVGQFTPTF